MTYQLCSESYAATAAAAPAAASTAAANH